MTFKFSAPARPVHTVFVHCSASDQPAHDDVSVMRAWHLGNGWNDVGYHFFIKKDGTIQPGRSLEQSPAAQSEWNPGTIAVCLHGLRRDAFTAAQLEALIDMATAMRETYAAKGVRLRFRGHVEVAAKACPVIDYRRVLGLDAEGFMVDPPDATPQLGGVIAGNLSSLGARPEALRLFSSGPRVEALQRALNDNGAAPPLLEDGDFGKATEAAVKAYQLAHGLEASGVVTPDMAARLAL